MKKFLVLLTIVTLLVGTFIFTGCGDESEITKTYRDTYFVSAIAGANYLESTQDVVARASNNISDMPMVVASIDGARGINNTTDNNPGNTTDNNTGAETTPPESNQGRPEEIAGDIDSVNSYINMFDGLISGDSFKAELTSPTEAEDGEYASYEKKMITRVAGQDYIMYFNEVEKETETEVEDDGVEEVEISSTVVGVLVNGESVFEISGKYETEKEGAEIETEMEFTTRSKTNPKDYVKVEQSAENDEIEYEYSIYENGNLVSKTKVEWEDADFEDDDDDDSGLSMQFGTATGDGYSKTKYHVTKERNNQLKVVYKTENSGGRFTIRQTESENIYTYSNGYEETLSR